MTAKVKIRYNGEPEIKEFLRSIGYTTIVTRNGKTEDMPRNFIISIESQEYMYAALKFGGEIVSNYKY